MKVTATELLVDDVIVKNKTEYTVKWISMIALRSGEKCFDVRNNKTGLWGRIITPPGTTYEVKRK